MRLRRIGLAVMATGFCGLMFGQAAAQQSVAKNLSGTPDAASILAQGNAFADNGGTRFQSPLREDFSPPSGEYAGAGRIQLALASPAIVQRASPAASAPPILGPYAAPPQSQQPSRWLMGGIVLLLIGYQLRRKHRLLRPHRFNTL